MRMTAEAERAIWGLVRGCVQAGGWQRVLGEAVIDVLQPRLAVRPSTPASTQLELWVPAAAGLPAIPWRLSASDTFRCVALGCDGLTVGACVTRQLATDRQRTQQASRGQGTDYPHCDTRTCAQGRELRRALGPATGVEWRGAGPGGRFDRGRRAAKGRAVEPGRA